MKCFPSATQRAPGQPDNNHNKNSNQQHISSSLLLSQMHRSNTEQKTYLLKKLYKFSPVNVYHATYLLTNVFCIIIPFIFCIIISIFAFVVSAFMAISGLEKSKNVFLLFLFLFFQNIILSLFSYHERETPRPECTLVSHLYEREQLFCLVKREKKLKCRMKIKS